MSQKPVAALFVHVDDGLRIGNGVGSTCELLHVGDQLSPFGGQNVDDVEILGLGFQHGRADVQEVNMGVARIPAVFFDVGPAPELKLDPWGPGRGHLKSGNDGFIFDSAQSLDRVMTGRNSDGEVRCHVGVGFSVDQNISTDILPPSDRNVLLVAIGRPVSSLGVPDMNSCRRGIAVFIQQVNSNRMELVMLGKINIGQLSGWLHLGRDLNDLPLVPALAEGQDQAGLDEVTFLENHHRSNPDAIFDRLVVGVLEQHLGHVDLAGPFPRQFLDTRPGFPLHWSSDRHARRRRWRHRLR